MLISEETKTQLNELVRLSFDANSVVDNLAYNIAYYDYPNIEKVIHEDFAHKFPAFADRLTNLMIKVNARPVRKGVDAHEEDYEGNLVKIFEDNLKMCDDYRMAIIQVIEVAELNEDYEIKIELEEFLNSFINYRKQADVWYKYAKRYEGDYKSFDVHFEEFTKFIEMSDED